MEVVTVVEMVVATVVLIIAGVIAVMMTTGMAKLEAVKMVLITWSFQWLASSVLGCAGEGTA
jgi:hypothetical protein